MLLQQFGDDSTVTFTIVSDFVKTQSRRFETLQFSYSVILRKNPDTKRYDKSIRCLLPCKNPVRVAHCVLYWKASSTTVYATRFFILVTK